MLGGMKWPLWKRSMATALVALAASAPWVVASAAENSERYPYDPVCAWGRLADGHGMLIRCIEPDEASTLLQAAPRPRAAAKPAPSVAAAQASEPATGKLGVTNIGPAQADTGELPLAVKKLGLAKDRYVECVGANGGLTEKTGKVVIRFLVRERGRAEGVSVKSHQGMSLAAAKCIADVIDRRYVGYPAAPLVGATIPIEIGAL
jgi:hypothetical protein